MAIKIPVRSSASESVGGKTIRIPRDRGTQAVNLPKTNLKNLVCLIDWNKGQNDGWSKDFSSMYDNLKDRISSFGWECQIIDGHDTDIIS